MHKIIVGPGRQHGVRIAALVLNDDSFAFSPPARMVGRQKNPPVFRSHARVVEIHQSVAARVFVLTQWGDAV